MIQSIDELSFGKQQFSPEQHLYTMNRQYLNLHFSAQPLAGSICTWSRLPAFVTYSGHKSMLIFTSTGCPPPNFTKDKYNYKILALTRTEENPSFALCFFAPCRSDKSITPLGNFQYQDILQGAISVLQLFTFHSLTNSVR